MPHPMSHVPLPVAELCYHQQNREHSNDVQGPKPGHLETIPGTNPECPSFMMENQGTCLISAGSEGKSFSIHINSTDEHQSVPETKMRRGPSAVVQWVKPLSATPAPHV